MDYSKIIALSDKQASKGELAHAVKEAQTLIHRLEDYAQTIQITGRLRHLDYDGHTSIDLLAIPTMTHAIADNRDFPDSQLHYELHKLIEDWEMPTPPDYRWNGSYYKWSLKTVYNVSQLSIAQVIHSGPENFSKWITSEETHRKGALPWGFNVTDYNLHDNHRNPIHVENEREFFAAIGYQFIDLHDRNDGNPDFWRKYKLPVAN